MSLFIIITTIANFNTDFFLKKIIRNKLLKKFGEHSRNLLQPEANSVTGILATMTRRL